MNKNQIEEKLELAVKGLYENQPNIYAFTGQTGQTEWNLAHHLANEIHKLLPEYDCDVDVTKHDYGNMRPDIIFHKRGTNEQNLLVVETKFKRNKNSIQSDIDKIQNEWFTGKLKYKFGASINLWDTNRTDIIVLENN
jgi:hypothetical protein